MMSVSMCASDSSLPICRLVVSSSFTTSSVWDPFVSSIQTVCGVPQLSCVKWRMLSERLMDESPEFSFTMAFCFGFSRRETKSGIWFVLPGGMFCCQLLSVCFGAIKRMPLLRSIEANPLERMRCVKPPCPLLNEFKKFWSDFVELMDWRVLILVGLSLLQDLVIL